MNDMRDWLHVGLSVPMVKEQLPELPELPECFELLELPGDALMLPGETLAEWLRKQHFEEISIRNIAPADLTRQVTCESGVIVQEFKAKLRALSERAKKFGAVTVGLDPDWEALFVETGRRDTFAEILRAVSGDLEYWNLGVDMAVRMPGSGAVSPERSLELLDQLPAYRLKLALDVNPHELLARPPEWKSVLAPFRFDVRTVRFAYESGVGNQLLFRQIKPILEGLAAYRHEVNIFLAPSGYADVEALAEVVREMDDLASGKTEDMLL